LSETEAVSFSCFFSLLLPLIRVFYRSMQNILSASLLYKYVKLEICVTVIVPVVSYGCETWSVTLREKHRLIVFENIVQTI